MASPECPAEDSPFDRLTALARAIFYAPSAMVSLIEDDRVQFYCGQGAPRAEMPREHSISNMLVQAGADACLVIEDAAADPRTANHPMVIGAPHLRWFVGATVSDAAGLPVGAFAVLDTRARPAPTEAQMEALGQLAKLAGGMVDRIREAREREDQLTMLRLAERMSGVGHWRWTVESDKVTWSDEVYRIHGLEPQSVEPTLRSMASQYSAADRPKLLRLMRRAIKYGEDYSYAVDLTRTDGSRRRVVADVVANVDPQTGRTLSLFGICQDVTEREQALETIKKSEERYRLLADNTGDVIARVRWDGTSKYISPAIEALLGWRYEEMSGRAMDYIHPDDCDAVLETVRRTIKTGRPHDQQHRAVHRDGSIIWVECRFQKIAESRHDKGEVVVVIRDICKRKALEQELHAAKEAAEAASAAMSESEARYRLIADRLTDVIITYGVDGIVTYVSPSAKSLSGLEPEQIVGRPVTDLIYEPDVPGVMEEFRAFLNGDVSSGRYRIRHTDGALRWMEARRAIVRDADGRTVAFQDVVRDITDTKALEDQLILEKERAEAAARAKSAFLANMSHELRTPLTSVIGFSDLLKQSTALGQTERRHVDRIAAGSEALLSVINDILDYSKLEAGGVEIDPHPFDPRVLAHSVGDLIEGQAARQGLTLTVEVDGSVPVALMGDSARLRQVLLNFMSNAVKFTKSGEIRLVVTAEPEVGGVTWVRAAVTDTGIGLTPETASRLFERFVQADASTTRSYGGTGLGLAISRQLIELMGGEVGAEGEPGVGSTFWLRAPLEAVEPEAAVGGGAAPEISRSGRILMADDAPANRELVNAILTGLGLEVSLVENGAQAVQAAQSNLFDLILMDVHMPVMDGLAATREIRRSAGPEAKTPILALTANVDADQVRDCLAAGMNGHLAKPIAIDKLVAALSRWLDNDGPVETATVDVA